MQFGRLNWRHNDVLCRFTVNSVQSGISECRWATNSEFFRIFIVFFSDFHRFSRFFLSKILIFQWKWATKSPDRRSYRHGWCYRWVRPEMILTSRKSWFPDMQCQMRRSTSWGKEKRWNLTEKYKKIIKNCWKIAENPKNPDFFISEATEPTYVTEKLSARCPESFNS